MLVGCALEAEEYSLSLRCSNLRLLWRSKRYTRLRFSTNLAWQYIGPQRPGRRVDQRGFTGGVEFTSRPEIPRKGETILF